MTHPFIDRILVPTDLSDIGIAALRYALAFHRRLGSSLTLLYGDDPLYPLDIAGVPMGYSMENAPESREQLVEKLRDWARRNAPGIAVDVRVVSDTPARAIVRGANDINADLIIMGTHGRYGLPRAFLGSVTERVLRDTDRPVLTVAQGVPAVDAVAVETILCPVNFTRIARESLKYAANLAASLDAELLILYVAEVSESLPLSRAGAELAAWIAPVVNERIRYKELTRYSDATAAVLQVADQSAADLIVIGVQHKFFRDATVIGTTTERIIRFAKLPVLTVNLHQPSRTDLIPLPAANFTIRERRSSAP